MPASVDPVSPGSSAMISVAIGQWGVAAAPTRIRTLLGSCVGVVLYDRTARLGGLAHVVLPDSRGATDHRGKYADTAIPAMIEDLERLAGARIRGRLIAKLVGGASMFQTGSNTPAALNIGQMNKEAVEQILADLRIPVQARDLGGDTGRHLTLDTSTGLLLIKIPGGGQNEL